MTETTSASADSLIAALRTSHERLRAAVTPLSPEDVVRPAYPSEWSIAQVMSHLGSGAEIFSAFLVTVAEGGSAPELADFTRIWDVWNAKEPQDQAEDSLTYDAAFLDRLSTMSAEERAQFRVMMFNGEQDLAGFLQLRLNEHAIHTWDVRVALDPTETLAPDATELMMPGLPDVVGRVSKPSAQELTARVTTEAPAAVFILAIGPDGAQLGEAAADTATSATLSMPAEALVRLINGRLDLEHTPVVQADGVELDQLRQVFPGF